MSVCLSLLVCFFVFGIFYLQRTIRHCIKQACMSWMASTSTQIASSSSSRDNSIGCKLHLMKRRSLVRIRSRPSLVWKCPKKNKKIAFSSSSSTSMRTQIASSSSSSTPSRRYDVFLSFHGEDTRKSFTDHIHAALKRKGIQVFIDDEKLERGKTISEELLKAIQESMYAVVVISPNYASSKWCLIELAKIIECMRETGLRVLPIFYHMDPSDVRNQTGTFAKAFAKHEASMRKKNPKADIDMMHKWRSALREVGNISGWHLHDHRPESIVVEEINRKILCGLSHNFSDVSKDLVGIESRVEEMESILGMGLDDVRFLGICGMGGIGKTTLAEIIYKRITDKFEASCFIPNVREETKNYGLLHLQKQVISEILGESETNIHNLCVATNMIANRIRKRRVLIILDDVDEEEQVEALAKSHNWFGHGSRIIITSRDLHFLNRLGVNTYKVKKLNNEEALELFSWKAFKKPHPEENYVELSKDIVSYAQGLPLALKVFGSMLFGRKMDAWKSARDLLKESPSAEILDKLRISYDGLEDTQKDLFLDFACFYNGANMDSIKHKLESFGYYPNINTEVLEGKSLITISEFGSLEMHDLLQKMGQKIVHDESAEPGKRSRLCHDKDVIHVLKNDTGTDAVKGIVLKLPLKKPERLNVEAFSKMKKLKMLQIGYHYFYAYGDNLCTNLEWHGDASNFMLSNELCVMEWWGYPLESLPTNFQSDNLVELIMHESCIKQLWVGGNSFDKLKLIDLSKSQNLIETPNLSGVPNLEELELSYCTKLSKVHRSIGFLRRLKGLNLMDCKHLKSLPDEMISLESLECLNLSGCSRLNKIPDSVGNMTSLQYLYLNETAIKKLPLSLKRLSSLKVLDISDCSRLEKTPKNLLSGMKCLESLYVGGSATREFPIGSGPDPMISLLLPNSFSCLSSLGELDLSYRNLSDGAIPNDLSCLSSLYSLNLCGNKFRRIIDSAWQLSNLRKLDLSYCNLLDGAIPNDLSCLSFLRNLNLSGNKFTRIPDRLAQRLNLFDLTLNDCRWLQVLPKLPLGLKSLRVKNCPLLELFYNKQMEMWRSSNEKLRSIDYSVVQAHFDYDGNPFKILHLHPRSPLWTESEHYFECFFPIASGRALVGSGIPEWFNDKSTNLFGTIQLHSDLGSDKYWKWYALFIVYEFHEPHTTHPRKRRKLKVDERKGNSNSTTIFDGSNSNLPNFVCHFQVDGVDVIKPLVFCAPGVPSVGPNGFWVYIPYEWLKPYWWFERTSVGRVEVSITTGSLNVEVKECGARLVRDEHDASALYQLLNTISPRALGFKSYENLFSRLYGPNLPHLRVWGPLNLML